MFKRNERKKSNSDYGPDETSSKPETTLRMDCWLQFKLKQCYLSGGSNHTKSFQEVYSKSFALKKKKKQQIFWIDIFQNTTKPSQATSTLHFCSPFVSLLST